MTAIQKNYQLKNEQAIFGWLKKIVVNNALQFIRKTSKDTFITTEPSEIPDTLTEMTTFAMDEKKTHFSIRFYTGRTVEIYRQFTFSSQIGFQFILY